MTFNKTIITTCALLLCLWQSTFAQAPDGYYDDACGKKSAELKTALCYIIHEHTDVTYKGLWEAYKTTDVREDGKLRDWYSNSTNYTLGTDQAGNYSKEGDCYNREHTVPQSWFKEASPMKADIFHVVPTDGYVNGKRSNYPFGEVDKASYSSKNDYCRLGSCKTAGYTGTVFEPADEIKGDLARIYFYMVTCYEKECTSWDGGIFTSSKYPGLVQWTLDMMLRWSEEDPVDDVEKARNEAIYKLQKNRNPFVDMPGIETFVWGSNKDMIWEGITSAIVNVESSTENTDDTIYTLSGQKLAAAKKGLCIVNGKKVLIYK